MSVEEYGELGPAPPQSIQALQPLTGGRVGGLINPRSENAKDPKALKEAAETALRRTGFEPDIRIARESGLVSQFTRLAKSSDILLAAGGDGTISAAARAASLRGKPLMVLPVGEANALAKDLDLPTGIEALDALEDAAVRQIDVGLVNGRPFVNSVVFGLYDEDMPSGAGPRMDRTVQTSSAILQQTARLFARLRWPWFRWRELGWRRWRLASGLVITNNPLVSKELSAIERASLDQGMLAVYEVEGTDMHSALKHFAFGRAASEVLPHIQVRRMREIFLDFPHDEVSAVVDGERRILANPIEISCARRALNVIVPRN